jgi:pimeloyl-ACP methyl ester carboxylesterase
MRLAGAPGDCMNAMLVPGGPGIGSESLADLVDCLPAGTNAWGVDLPGDGSNAHPDPYSLWPDVLVEAACHFPHTVMVGHSTGGEYILSVPEIERHASGIVLVSTAPDASWMPVFEQMCRDNPLPGYDAALAAYTADPNLGTLTALCVASAPWNAETPEGLAKVTDLLGRMPYNAAAVEWSAEHFDRTYRATWLPREIPTLIVSGVQDRIVIQRLWDALTYQGDSVRHARIDRAGHWPWLDQPGAVAATFRSFVLSLPSWLPAGCR